MKAELEGEAPEIAQVIALQPGDGPAVETADDASAFREGIDAALPPKKKIRRARKKRAGRVLVRWSKKDDDRLKKEHKAKSTIKEIAEILGRTEKAVTLRIIKMRNSGEIKGD